MRGGKRREMVSVGLNKTRSIGYRQLNKEYRSGTMPSANVDALLRALRWLPRFFHTCTLDGH